MLTNGFDRDTNTGQFRDVTCAGALKIGPDGKRAELPDFQYRASSSADSKKTVVICFKKGQRWFVESVRATGCELSSSDAK